MNRTGGGRDSGGPRDTRGPMTQDAIPQGPTIRSVVFMGQVITFALAKGAVIFSALAVYLVLSGTLGGDGGDGPAANGATAGGPTLDQALPLLGVLLLAVGGVAAVWVPGLLRSQAIGRFRQSGETITHPLAETTPLPPATPIGNLVAGLMSATLVSQAILEGVASANAMFLILTGQWFVMIPASIAIFGIVAQVPTAGKVMDRLEMISRS